MKPYDTMGDQDMRLLTEAEARPELRLPLSMLNRDIAA